MREVSVSLQDAAKAAAFALYLGENTAFVGLSLTHQAAVRRAVADFVASSCDCCHLMTAGRTLTLAGNASIVFPLVRSEVRGMIVDHLFVRSKDWSKPEIRESFSACLMGSRNPAVHVGVLK